MEHHGFDWTGDEDGHDGNAETADLGGDDDLGSPDLGGHDLGGFGDFGESDLGGPDQDLGGPDAGGHDAGGLEEPLGTENAAATFDASVGHEGDFDDPFGGHDPGGEPGDHDGAGESGLHGAHDGGDPGDGPDGPGDDGPGDDGPGLDLVGTDPHLDHTADDPGWDDQPFPPDLGITDPPEPVDGFPWSDPAALGEHADATDDYAQTFDGALDDGAPADLAAYDGVELPPGIDAWTALLGSEDPATSALARWWAPGG